MSAVAFLSVIGLLITISTSFAASADSAIDNNSDNNVLPSSLNNSVLIEAVMIMYGAARQPNNQPSLSRAQLHDLISFGKNVSRKAFVETIRDRLHSIKPWGSAVQCESVESLLNDTSILSSRESVNGTEELAKLLPRLFFSMQNPECFAEKPRPRSLTDPFAWLYSFLAVLVMKFCALVGILAFPCMSATVYTMALSFLVPLAISSLMGSTLFIFLPEILNLPNIDHYEENFGEPVIKMLAVGAGIYLFYLIEKLLRLLMEHKEKKFYNKTALNRSYSLNVAQESVAVRPSRKISTTMAGDISSFPRQMIQNTRDSRIELAMTDNATSVVPNEDDKKEAIAPIAWIAIMGDCIRNFIDGTAIGAAFSISPLVGVSLSLAFVFEEIPTELGDVAILLSAGMTICRASMYHFFAAIFAFIGAAFGILLGDLGQSQIWIFAISAGAFLYIALVDLMPEMNHALESDKAKGIGRLKIFLLQNVGLVLGFGVTAVLGIFKDQLHFDFGGSGDAH